MARLYRTSLRTTLAMLMGLALIAVTITLLATLPAGANAQLTPIDPFNFTPVHALKEPAVLARSQVDASPTASTKVLYIYQHDSATAGQFKALLDGAGLTVTTTAISAVPGMDVSTFGLIIVADDTGYLDQWGAVPTATGVISQLVNAYKPIIGLGEGGYAFFGKAGSPTGWPNGWHGPQDSIYATNAVPNYYLNPNDLSGLLPGPFPIYSAPVNEVGIYMPAVPASVLPIAFEPYLNALGAHDHASLTLDGCYNLWGFSGGPSDMNDTGKKLFVNAAVYMGVFQCPRPTTPPPPDCLTIVKTAVPPSGTTVHPGDTIKYTLTYTVTDNKQCETQRSVLFDHLPNNTLFVPGSASDGQIPNFDDTLVWNLGPLPAAAHGSKTFSVSVADTACRGQQVITNTGRDQTTRAFYTTNTPTPKVDCPPVTFPNEDPPYAEREIQIYPYPLVTGQPTQLSVRVYNLGATSQTVTVTFQTSPNRFGIGIPFSALPVPGNPRVVTLGPFGYAEVQVNWTPVSSGHYCIQVKVEGAGFAPIYTQHNLDVTEDLKPGVTDVLTFSVANPTAATANITLTVDNTCPGWTAVVNPPVIPNAVPGTIYTATLSVTPPNPAILGTGCHIDVQGWIGDKLIGGLRKLEGPPVHLPPSDPPWLEKEISTIPSPPISGTLNQVCIELNNPLGFTRTVTVTFSEAVFGAGIPFTPINPAPTYVFNLPPHSLQKYCVPWLPIASASLHHCLLVTLSQPGFQDQRSQRNVDLVRLRPQSNPGDYDIPFRIGNPFGYPTEVNLNAVLIDLLQFEPRFTPNQPDFMLGPGETRDFMLQLVPAVRAQAAVPDGNIDTGDVSRVDVTVSFDGKPYSGFSVEFAPPLQVFLPVVMKNG